MRFLENLVSDMIRESTGYDARRAVRLIGGRRLVKMGAGAAALGGLAYLLDKHGSTGRGPAPGASGAQSMPPPPPPASGGSPPPLPPIPGSGAGQEPGPATPPPLPPVPGPGASGAVEEEPGGAELPPAVLTTAIRAMAAGAAADGHLGDREREVLERHLARATSGGLLDAETRARLESDLEDPPSPGKIAAGVETEADRETVFRLAALVLLADEGVSEMERGWLRRLGEALGFDRERQAALESELFEES